MSSKTNKTINVESLSKEIATWVEQDKENPGAWNMFTLVTLKRLKSDYEITMQYFSQITKEQFNFVIEAIEDIVYHFQRIEMVELVEKLYCDFYGENKNTNFYRDNIEGLRNCIKNK